MGYKLFLDDVRSSPSSDWTVARTLSEFKAIIERQGAPDVISFDYQLGGEETGLDAAKWVLSKKISLRKFRVHSSSSFGRERITSLLSPHYNKF